MTNLCLSFFRTDFRICVFGFALPILSNDGIEEEGVNWMWAVSNDNAPVQNNIESHSKGNRYSE